MAVLVGYGPKTTEAKRRPRKAAPADPASEQAHAMLAAARSLPMRPVSRRTDEREPLHADPDGANAPLAPRRPCRVPARPRPSRTVTGASVLAKPPVRKLAKDLGI